MGKTIYFGGYAPVHFLCYLPVYQRLRADRDVDLAVTGGLRVKEGEDFRYEEDGFFDAYDVDSRHIVKLADAQRHDYDVVVASHLSDGLFPKSGKKTVQIFHGVSFKNLAVREKALRFDVLCLPGRYHAERYREQGLIREGTEYVLTGFPKADALVAPGFDRAAFLARYELSPDLPTVLFAPTGEKRNALEEMGEEVIEAIDKGGKWNLIVKPHDHPKKPTRWDGLSKLQNDRIRIIRERDVIPCLRAADLLLTDASSVAVEYTLLDRPIVFLEVPKLLDKIAKRAPALDLQTYGRRIGSVTAGPEELCDSIDEALANPNREQEVRHQMSEHVFYKPGGAVERVAKVIRYAAGLDAAVPDDAEVLDVSA